jgi:hypothetical protein
MLNEMIGCFLETILVTLMDGDHGGLNQNYYIMTLKEPPSSPMHRYTNMGKSENFYLLTPLCRIFFEKLIVIQLVKQQPAFFMEPEVSSPCSESPPPDPNRCQPNPV